MPARQRVIVAMIDGLDPAYVSPQTMPVFAQLARDGTSCQVSAVMPTVTNVNNAGISCAAWPEEHGVTGNYYYDRDHGEQGYMEESRFLLRPTLMARVTAAGGQAALLTAKKKSVSLLGDRTTLAVAAEEPPPEFTARYGPAPEIYSAEINHWLWRVAVGLLETRPEGPVRAASPDLRRHGLGLAQPGRRRGRRGVGAARPGWRRGGPAPGRGRRGVPPAPRPHR
jgi:phosphonoacetate hydrolase